MVLTVGNTKGGVGKTTLAVNLTIALSLRACIDPDNGAHRFLDVLLIDGDEQGTAMAFTELRTERLAGANGVRNGVPAGAGYTAVALTGAAIRTQVRQLRSKYDHIVIDVGGRDSGSLRAALTVSDCILIPTAPRSFDLWGVDQTADLVREAREINENLFAVAVLNGADPRGQDNIEAQDALIDLEGIDAAPFRLVRRKAYPNAAAEGLSVLEDRDGALGPHTHNQAALEFLPLVDFLFTPTLERKL